MENPKINSINTGTARQQTSSNTSSRRPINNTISNNNQSSRPVGHVPNYGVVRNATSLHEGDTIRGEISDLRNNEITVTLENNTIVKGTVPDSSTLSIGQTAAFKLSSDQAGSVLLNPIPKSLNESEWTMINKALDEANLPITERNQTAVKALMDNLLPINKESIQNLMQQSYDCNTDDMNTLAVMNRLMMKIDAESVAQFSGYRNGTNQIIEQLQNLSEDLPALLDTLANNGPSDAVAAFGEKLLNILLTSSTGSQNTDSLNSTISVLSSEQHNELINLLSGLSMTEDTLLQLENGSLSIHDALTMIRDAASTGNISYTDTINADILSEKLHDINKILEPAAPMDYFSINDTTEDADNASGAAVAAQNETIEEILPDTNPEVFEANDSGTLNTAKQLTHFATNFLQNIAEAAKNSINSTLQSLQGEENVTFTSAGIPDNTIIDALINSYSKISHEEDLLNTFLSPEKRNELADKLMEAPVSKSLIEKVISGEASSKEVLTVIKNIVPLSPSDKIQELFKSEPFVKLFSKALISDWSLTPDNLKNNGELSSFYQKLQSQMKGIESLIKSTLSGSDSENISNTAHNINSNIDFMKTLGETFSYLQMPLKLQTQNTNADLYVYTQKNKLRQHPEKASVLLHLSMDSLGTFDVYINKNNNDVNTRFMLNDQSSIDLLKTNSDLLKTALNELGYSCQVKVENADADTSTVDQFINTKINTSATSDMKRFSFDIRA